MLVEKFGVDESSIETQSISSTISSEMRSDAIKAVIVACIFMLLYIWFRFKDIRFATSAILALVHDVLVVLTAYALIRISVGGTFIACMLTIVGYSVNDTIVIFDRIRENMHGLKNQDAEGLAEIANKSLTQTLSRSINTSITTFIMVLLLFIMGVSSIREFDLHCNRALVCDEAAFWKEQNNKEIMWLDLASPEGGAFFYTKVYNEAVKRRYKHEL